MQPKVIRKLRPYYTYMHLCSATSKDRAFKKTGFDSTLVSHETVRVLRLKHTEKDTHTHKKKIHMDIDEHLEKYDSSNHHVGHLRRAL